ncbi:MAG: acetyl-coenzyme A synthetase N-terminal domain-containing protein, partial [Geminicoccaceae bacterium]
MTAKDLYPVPSSFASSSHCDASGYAAMYARSIEDNEGFWAEQAKRLDWEVFPTKIKDVDFADQARIRWYEDGVLNVCYNCVDRHLETRGDQTA